MYKKILSASLSIAILNAQVYASTITGTPNPTDPNALVQCKFKESSEYYSVGDTRGNTVLTKKETVRDCNITKTVQGECIKWKDSKTVQSIPQEAYMGFDTKDYTDSVGSFFAATGAYDQLEHLWSGYRGYCVSGTLQDFSWASDPMFWSSMVMSYLMSGGAGAESSGFNSGVETVGKKAATEGIAEGLTEAAAKEVYKSLGKCLVGGSFNLIQDTANFMQDGSGDNSDDCDPIDEICDDEETKNDDSSIKTMDRVQFDDLVDSFASEGKNLYEYVDIIDDGASTGIITFKMKSPSQVQGAQNMNNKEMEKLKQKVKLIKLGVDMAITAGTMAACMYTDGSVSGVKTKGAHDNGDTRLSVDSAVNAGIDLGAKLIPVPYGPIAAAALKILYAFATSFQSVDTCHDEKDAQQQGSRHEKTQKALKYNLCRPLYDTCDDEWLWGGCCLTGYHYCCYDQLLTKVLVEQMKAELGRDWSNCTGISLRDLNYISFEQCSNSEMADGLDGAHQYGINWDPQEAFQYKHKCMDLTEFKDYLKDIVGENIDQDSFNDFWDNLTDKSPM